LTKNNIEFIPQHTFTDLKYKSLLRCDFYIPSYNLVIEYNGRQHYYALDFFDGKKGLESTQKRDKIKQDYCIKNRIGFEVIKYDENVIDELIKIFN
jgi:very-short-patch-repair endonuclease